MSFDLVVFDSSVAPSSKSLFLEWYEGQREESQDSSELDSRELRRFFNELSLIFPAMNGPHASDDIDNPKVTDYAFGPHSIYMCFAWSQAEEARRRVIDLAKLTSVGFYGISDPSELIRWPIQAGEFDVFYCFHASGEEVPSSTPLSMPLGAVVSELLPRLVHDTDFIGVVDGSGTTLQFMLLEADQRVWMEIPAPSDRGSYGTHVSLGDLPSVIGSLPAQFLVEAFPSLEFHPW